MQAGAYSTCRYVALCFADVGGRECRKRKGKNSRPTLKPISTAKLIPNELTPSVKLEELGGCHEREINPVATVLLMREMEMCRLPSSCRATKELAIAYFSRGQAPCSPER